MSVTTQRHRLGAVKDFFRWLCKQDYLEANPASGLELPRPEKQLPEEPLTENQVQQVLSGPMSPTYSEYGTGPFWNCFTPPESVVPK